MPNLTFISENGWVILSPFPYCDGGRAGLGEGGNRWVGGASVRVERVRVGAYSGDVPVGGEPVKVAVQNAYRDVERGVVFP